MKLRRPEEFNIPLATKVLDHVTVHPDMHDQRTVMDSCHTRGCIAGWTVEFGKNVDFDRYLGLEDARIMLGVSIEEAGFLFLEVFDAKSARRELASWIKQATKVQHPQPRPSLPRRVLMGLFGVQDYR